MMGVSESPSGGGGSSSGLSEDQWWLVWGTDPVVTGDRCWVPGVGQI